MTETAPRSSSYKCIECLAPCSTLYRQYTASPSSIKLTTCSQCGSTVDPYIEREWLLVVLDCILLRAGAYRHVLFNRLVEKVSTRRAVQYVVASSMLSAYLKWEALRHFDASNKELGSTTTFASLLFLSVLELVLTWFGTYKAIQVKLPKDSAMSTTADLDLKRKLYLAILQPTALNVVIVLILIWENTPAVRLLGTLFLATYQYTAISAIEQGFGIVQYPGTALVAGMLLRALGTLLASQLLTLIISSNLTYPCVGLEVPLWFMKHPFCLT